MSQQQTRTNPKEKAFIEEVMNDFRLACESRETSLLGRKEVLTGKAKFGIFGDGKEIAQIALAKNFKNGDFRSGYYRDQTWMFAIGGANIQQFFAQLYADPVGENDPFSYGRQMNAHFSTPFLDENGEWLKLTEQKNSSADASPTASQMARALGLAMASKVYRNNPELKEASNFSIKGNEVAFASIGDASTSEGVFWEAVNAAGVMQIPLAVNIWDDGYGISVPRKYQTTKDNISTLLSGFQSEGKLKGYEIYTAKGWDYAGLCQMYQKGIEKMRKTHTPAIFHVTEVTQPQGHSTSGSHERYKSKDRLAWEQEFDGIVKMREWILINGFASEDQLDEIQAEAKKTARAGQKAAWENYIGSIKAEIAELTSIYDRMAANSPQSALIQEESRQLLASREPFRRDMHRSVRKVLRTCRGESSDGLSELRGWLQHQQNLSWDRYNSQLHSETPNAALNVESVPAEFSDDSKMVNGFELLNACFDNLLEKHPEVIAFGEDLGKIGDVNQGFAGLQDKHGEHRVFDTGIRENTIIGQGIGLAMRGLRPIAEIQYLDYLIYGLQPMVDDLATLLYRTKGRQRSPLIVRTRGHRLEGIWHTGSPIGMIVHALRGVHVMVPRNMTQAAGFYNTLMASDEPGLVIECLNGYRLKERMPDNLADFKLPLGVPETLIEGDDVTLVTYGSCVRVAEEAISILAEMGISVELIDVQTLLPFDLDHRIIESVKKTSRLVFFDEDVPGGATAYMMQKVMEEQQAFQWLDAEPVTIAAAENRSAYGTDGDYFCKPSADDVVEKIYAIMHESDPGTYPEFL